MFMAPVPISTFASRLPILPQKSKKQLLQRIWSQARCIVLLVAPDQSIAPEQLRYAHEGVSVQAMGEY